MNKRNTCYHWFAWEILLGIPALIIMAMKAAKRIDIGMGIVEWIVAGAIFAPPLLAILSSIIHNKISDGNFGLSGRSDVCRNPAAPNSPPEAGVEK